MPAIFSRRVGPSSSFLRHYDEAPTLLKSQPQICAIGADGGHLLYGTALACFGPIIIPFILISTFWGWQFLSTSNYIEHYGLLREKLPDGRYERCRPEHSWNADHIVSNLMLYHLQRHSDHHARPTRRYQALRSDAAPELPSGYPGCFTLTYFPPLWRAVMDKRVLAVYGGDITKVNIQPSKRQKILAKYGVSEAAAR